jgi:hypothetical protein
VKALHLLIERIEPREGSRKASEGWLWMICPVRRAVSEWPLFARTGRSFQVEISPIAGIRPAVFTQV